jgi:hypothetical protein
MNFMNSQQGKQHSIKYQSLSHHGLHKPKPTRKISKVKELITIQATHHKLSKELHDELHQISVLLASTLAGGSLSTQL